MASLNSWTTRDIPSQEGRLAIVTGSTQGIGYEVALALAGAGAQVIICARTADKGRAAIEQIKRSFPTANLRTELLDLASLRSVRDFGERLLAADSPIHLLVNNAAIMAPPQRQTTEDGFEAQFQVNYLGHFALTALLLPLLRQAPSPRVTTVSSVANRSGQINFDDLQHEKKYKAMEVYGQSKLATLMFALELQRRSDAHGWGLLSNAAHPGISATNLIPNSQGENAPAVKVMKLLGSLARQSPAMGALPPLYAATAPDAQPGEYYGPKNVGETRGPVSRARIVAQAKDEQVARKLWQLSEELVRVSFPETS